MVGVLPQPAEAAPKTPWNRVRAMQHKATRTFVLPTMMPASRQGVTKKELMDYRQKNTDTDKKDTQGLLYTYNTSGYDFVHSI